MAGQTGNEKVTVENLIVVKVDRKNNHLIVKGAIPGAKNRTIVVTK